MPCTVVAIDVDGALAAGEGDGSIQVCAVIVEGFIERDSGVVVDLSLVELEDGASECKPSVLLLLVVNGKPIHTVAGSSLPGLQHNVILYTILIYTVDFSLSNQTITFTASDATGAQRCGLVTITDDSTVENNETFAVFFASMDPMVELVSDQTTVTIIDNDSKSANNGVTSLYCCLPSCLAVVMVQWQFPTYTGSENTGFVQVCAELSQLAEREITFMISSAPLTATGETNL